VLAIGDSHVSHVWEHQHDDRMVEMLEFVFWVWWRGDRQACKANLQVAARLVLHSLHKLHFVDLLFQMFGLDHYGMYVREDSFDDMMCELVIESGKAGVLAKMLAQTHYQLDFGVEDRLGALVSGVGNAQLSDYLRSKKLYGMLQLVVCHPRLGSYMQDLVAELLAGWKPRWNLLSCMSRQPGFWQAFRACNGVLLAARDFEAKYVNWLGRSGHSSLFLAAAELHDDATWEPFGAVVRNNLGLVVKLDAAYSAVFNLLGMRAVRQAFVDCDGLVTLAKLIAKPREEGLYYYRLQWLYNLIKPTNQDKHHKMVCAAYQHMVKANQRLFANQ
jgi:hypothetical protein